MPFQITEENAGRILVIRVTGKLVKADYAQLAPQFEALVRQKGKLPVLFDLTGFEGWDAGAAWEDLKFDLAHFSDISRLAVVGDKKWHHAIAAFSKPFMKGPVQYFDQTETAAARRWLAEDQESGKG